MNRFKISEGQTKGSIQIRVYGVDNPTLQDLIDAVQEVFPDKKLSDIRVIPCMVLTMTDGKDLEVPTT